MKTTGHDDIAVQAFFQKIDTVLPQLSGRIHTLEAAIVKTADSVENVSKVGRVQILGRMKICRAVDTALEEFLDLIQEHQQLSQLDRGHTTLTVTKTI